MATYAVRQTPPCSLSVRFRRNCPLSNKGCMGHKRIFSLVSGPWGVVDDPVPCYSLCSPIFRFLLFILLALFMGLVSRALYAVPDSEASRRALRSAASSSVLSSRHPGRYPGSQARFSKISWRRRTAPTLSNEPLFQYSFFSPRRRVPSVRPCSSRCQLPHSFLPLYIFLLHFFSLSASMRCLLAISIGGLLFSSVLG